MMKANVRAAFGLFFLLTACLLFIVTQGCVSKFGNYEKISKVDKTCLAQVGLTKTPPSSEELMKSDFDDKGYATCMMYGLELMNEEGMMERDILMDMIDENAPKTLTSKLTEIVDKCANSAKIEKAKVMKDGKSKKDNLPFSNFYGCFVSSAEKLC